MRKVMLYAAAAIALCFMAPGLADPYQSPRLLALGIVAVALLLMPSRYESRLEDGVIGGLLLWACAAIATSDRWYTVFGSYLQPFDGFTAVIVYAGLALGIARLGLSANEAADAICWTSLPLSAYAIAQRFLADPLLPQALPGGRVIATQGSPVYLGPVLAIVIACALGRRRWAALALALPALYFTGTRGAMMGACTAAALLAPRRLRAAVIAAGAAVLVFHPRAHTAGSDLGRLEIWRISWDIFKGRPFFGVGPGVFGEAFRAHVSSAYISVRGTSLAAADHAHNELLQVLATTGMVGGLAYLLLSFDLFTLAIEDRLLLAAGAAYLVPAMLNPAPHAAVALLAILFGSASAREWEAQPQRWALAGAAAVSVMLTARVVAADCHFARAVRAQDPAMRAAEANRAAQLNPWEPRLTGAQLDTVAGLTNDPAVAGASVDIARELVARHPLDSSAHEILGLALARAAVTGAQTGDEAMLEYDRAQQFAPTYAPLMLRRLALARALGLAGEAALAGQQLARVKALERGGA